MKKALILFNYPSEKHTQIFNILKEEIINDYELECGFLKDDINIIGKENSVSITINGIDLQSYSQVIIYKTGAKSTNWTMASLIGHYCRLNKIPCFNTKFGINLIGGKILSKILFVGNNINTPDFIFLRNISADSYDEIAKVLGNKFVAKQSKASLGKKVILVSNKDEYLSKINQFKHCINNAGLWFFEEFIPHEFTTRGFVTGNKCNLIIEVKVETEENSFKTNHGEAHFIQNNISEELQNICIKSAQIHNLQISGVDTVLDTRDNKIKVFEVNQGPGITLLPNISPEIYKIAEFIKEN